MELIVRAPLEVKKRGCPITIHFRSPHFCNHGTGHQDIDVETPSNKILLSKFAVSPACLRQVAST